MRPLVLDAVASVTPCQTAMPDVDQLPVSEHHLLNMLSR
jgi:hypothetical protein